MKPAFLLWMLVLTVRGHAAFIHPGCLQTQADMALVHSNILAGNEPWKSA